MVRYEEDLGVLMVEATLVLFFTHRCVVGDIGIGHGVERDDVPYSGGSWREGRWGGTTVPAVKRQRRAPRQGQGGGGLLESSVVPLLAISWNRLTCCCSIYPGSLILSLLDPRLHPGGGSWGSGRPGPAQQRLRQGRGRGRGCLQAGLVCLPSSRAPVHA